MARYHVQMTFETPAFQGAFAHGSRPGRGQQLNLLGGDGELAVTGVVNADSAPEAATVLHRQVRKVWTRHGRGPLQLRSWTARRVRFAGLLGQRDLLGPELWDDGPGDEGGGLAGVREPRRPLPGPGSMSAELPIPGSPEAVA